MHWAVPSYIFHYPFLSETVPFIWYLLQPNCSVYMGRKMSHFVLKQIADERKPFISCLLAVITRALITPDHWHPGSGRMTTEASKKRWGSLARTVFPYPNHSIFFMATVFQLGGEKKKKKQQQTCTQSRLLNVYYYFIRSLTVRTCIWAWQSRARTMCQPARWVN